MTHRNCNSCKHIDVHPGDFPCSACDYRGSNWEPKEERIATAPAEPRNDSEEVNHPKRYNHGEYECIDVMIDVFGKEAVQNFCLLSAFKYVWRKDYKGGIQDIKKAMWYLDKWLELEGENHE